jgi:hypothetical protein
MDARRKATVAIDLAAVRRDGGSLRPGFLLMLITGILLTISICLA